MSLTSQRKDTVCPRCLVWLEGVERMLRESPRPGRNRPTSRGSTAIQTLGGF